MQNKVDYVQLISDMFKGGQYGLESIEVEDIGRTVHSWDVGLPTVHIPDKRLKIFMRGNGGCECTAEFRGRYMWRNCYKFIKSAYKHL